MYHRMISVMCTCLLVWFPEQLCWQTQQLIRRSDTAQNYADLVQRHGLEMLLSGQPRASAVVNLIGRASHNSHVTVTCTTQPSSSVHTYIHMQTHR